MLSCGLIGSIHGVTVRAHPPIYTHIYTHMPQTDAAAYVPSGYWTVDLPSVQVRARNHARPGKGEVLLDLSSSSSSADGTCVYALHSPCPVSPP